MKTSEWISKHIRASAQLNTDILESVSDFTLMWALFEASESDSENIINQIPRFSQQVSENMPSDYLDEIFIFWKNRYILNGESTHRFSHLNFRDKQQTDLVLSVLKEQNTSLPQKTEALLLIVYRLRNNLFHGLKDITNLNDQQGNFDNATSLLQILLPLSSRHLFLGLEQQFL